MVCPLAIEGNVTTVLFLIAIQNVAGRRDGTGRSWADFFKP